MNFLTIELGALASFVATTFGTHYFVLFALLVCLFEWLKPAEARRRFNPKALLYDFSAGMVAISCQFLISNIILLSLFSLYEPFIPRLLGATNDWTGFVRAAVALVIGDFLNWVTHVVRHKVPFLWRFHALHHSQRHMNMFTEFRAHPLDIVINSSMQSMALYLLYVPFEMSVVATVIFNYYLMFIHANVDVSYGWADRILVSPAYHRTHHAMNAEMHDRNFGAMLSVWDALFGTALFERPAVSTGVEEFPDELSSANWHAPMVYLKQLTLPFRRRGTVPIQKPRVSQ